MGSRTTFDTVPDVVAPGLDILFCGINPGRRSGHLGQHFAGTSNRFWKVLHQSGLTDRQLAPSEQRALLARGIGITNLVPRTTASADELAPAELRAGGQRLARLVAELQPMAVAVLGIGAYRTAFGQPKATVGRQAEELAGVPLWVLPNPSGLQASYQLPALVALFGELVAFVGGH